MALLYIPITNNGSTAKKVAIRQSIMQASC